jgi:hypothetical protein
MRCNIIGETLSLTWHNGAAEYSPNLFKIRDVARTRAASCLPRRA